MGFCPIMSFNFQAGFKECGEAKCQMWDGGRQDCGLKVNVNVFVPEQKTPEIAPYWDELAEPKKEVAEPKKEAVKKKKK